MTEAEAEAAPPRQGRLRRALHRLTSDVGELEAEQLQGGVAAVGATAIGACGRRQRVTVTGVLQNVTLRPVGGVPALETELYDGSGTVTLVFLGRRRIPGVEPGRAVVVRGLVADRDGRKTIYNPAYDLRPAGG